MRCLRIIQNDLAKNAGHYKHAFDDIAGVVEKESIPSIAARLKKIRKQTGVISTLL
jgi:hypothetical protein